MDLDVPPSVVEYGRVDEVDVVVRSWGSVGLQDANDNSQTPWLVLDLGKKGGGLRVDPAASLDQNEEVLGELFLC